MTRIARIALLTIVAIAGLAAMAGVSAFYRMRAARAQTRGPIYLNRDLSSGDLSQWSHKDYGQGTDKGANSGGAGLLWYHANVEGRRAAGLTATPTAHASPADSSDSVYLWEPSAPWNYQPYEIWVRMSVLFPSADTIRSIGSAGEWAYQPTTGEFNWILGFHNDSTPEPACSKEYANVALTVRTDDTVQSGIPGMQNVRLSARVMGGDDCAPSITWIDGPKLKHDHWYDFLLHIKWATSGGVFEWYVDDLKKPHYSNANIPTLYTRPPGYVSPSYTSLTLGNYRLHAPWNSTIYYGPLLVGNSKSAVMQ